MRRSKKKRSRRKQSRKTSSPKKRSKKSQPEKPTSERPSEFKFFHFVEDTIEAILAFVVGYAKTVLILAFTPHLFPGKWRNSPSGFPKPFLLTAVSSFIYYLSLVGRMRHELNSEYEEVFNATSEQFIDYFSLTRFFTYSIGIITVLYLLAHMLGRVTSEKKSWGIVARLALYAASFQCLTAALDFWIDGNIPSRALGIYGFCVCSIVVWKAIPSEMSWKEVWRDFAAPLPFIWRGAIVLLYSFLSWAWVSVFIVFGFATELAFSPVGPALVEEARKREVEKVIGSVIENMESNDEIDAEARRKIIEIFRN